MAACIKNVHCGYDFDCVLAIFRPYDYGTKASEAVEKIALDEKDYPKYSFCFIVCISAAIPIKLENAVHQDTSGVAKTTPDYILNIRNKSESEMRIYRNSNGKKLDG